MKLQKDWIGEVLGNLMANKTVVLVFLVNGVKLEGIITSMNDDALAIGRDGQEGIIMWNAVSTIYAAKPRPAGQQIAVAA